MSGKGALKQAALVRAAADVLLEQGFDAVTHRAVAARAGLPLGATTYYFASRSDLLASAVDLAAQGWLHACRARLEAAPPAGSPAWSPGRAADAVLDVLSGGYGREQLLVLYQRHLESARHPGLRSAVLALDERAQALVAEVLLRAGLPGDARTSRLVLATADGLLVGALARGEAVPQRYGREPLSHLLELLAGSTTGVAARPSADAAE